ncbi:cysteine methyltransferase [bacterium (Candidatus Torokbacteria) CG_4_10_14_0_2_um_filter_35_8]|nr:MAG: cysteine methyltransferase [bacterium (Candidatus Torokbacteria) CG_4_10_14_0_2_um_filter_35_8]
MKKSNFTPFEKKVYLKTAKIPKGKVTTYQEITEAIGKPDSQRAAGNTLNKNPFAPKVPCHRVIRKNGEIGGFGRNPNEKIKLLQKEGVEIKNGKIANFKKYFIRLS